MSMLEELREKYDRLTIPPSILAYEANLSDTHIRRLCKQGVIGGVKVGDRWIIPIAAAAAFLDGESN